MTLRSDHPADLGARDRRALDDARQVALAALRASGPARPWQTQARSLIVGVAAMTLVGAAVVLAAGGAGWSLAASRVPALALLLGAQMAALWAAVAPRTPAGWRATVLAAVLVAAGGGAVLVGRDVSAADVSTGWICSLSHLTFGLAPLAAVVWALRDMASGGLRAVTAGLAVATTGLFWGEIACQRGILHVLSHHFGAAALLATACLVASRLVPRRSFAP